MLENLEEQEMETMAANMLQVCIGGLMIENQFVSRFVFIHNHRLQ